MTNAARIGRGCNWNFWGQVWGRFCNDAERWRVFEPFELMGSSCGRIVGLGMWEKGCVSEIEDEFSCFEGLKIYSFEHWRKYVRRRTGSR